MTLAGNMKLKNFVLIAVAAVALGSFGLYAACSGKHEDKAERQKEEAQKRASAVALTPDAAVPPAGLGGEKALEFDQKLAAQAQAPVDLAAREWDKDVIAWKGRSINSDKLKDAIKGKSYKVNLYKDAGSSTVDRAKIDINKNSKWDEKISFKGDEITLERAPADDENYTEKYHWNGTGWIKAK